MTAAVHTDILDAVVTAVQALALTGVADAAVLKRKFPSSQGVPLPCVLVTPWGQEAERPGVNVSDDWGYPVLVTILAANPGQDPTYKDQEILWRQQIRRAFHRKKLASVGTVYECLVEPQPIMDLPTILDKDLYVSALLLRAWSRELRT